MKKALAVLGMLFFSFGFSSEKVEEKRIVDAKPLHQSWIQEQNGLWKLTFEFEKATLVTYFKHPPQEGSFLGFDQKNKPLRQELFLNEAKKPILLKHKQFEKFSDGALSWSFKVDKKIKRKQEVFSGLSTVLIDDPIGNKNEYRYTLWK